MIIFLLARSGQVRNDYFVACQTLASKKVIIFKDHFCLSGLACSGVAWASLARRGLVWPGLAWPGLAQSGLVRRGLAWPGWPGKGALPQYTRNIFAILPQ